MILAAPSEQAGGAEEVVDFGFGECAASYQRADGT